MVTILVPHFFNILSIPLLQRKGGGHMLNCESCPAAHHPSCLKISTNPSDLDGWQCPDCIAGINPLHGDVVWVKFGSYRLVDLLRHCFFVHVFQGELFNAGNFSLLYCCATIILVVQAIIMVDV